MRRSRLRTRQRRSLCEQPREFIGEAVEQNSRRRFGRVFLEPDKVRFGQDVERARSDGYWKDTVPLRRGVGGFPKLRHIVTPGRPAEDHFWIHQNDHGGVSRQIEFDGSRHDFPIRERTAKKYRDAEPAGIRLIGVAREVRVNPFRDLAPLGRRGMPRNVDRESW